MITEHAILDVRPGQEREFEQAFVQAKRIIARASRFVSLQLHRGINIESRYLLIVRWLHLADHTEGFRKSNGYQEWKALLHDFYDPFATVEYFGLIERVEPEA